jgi:hypothetical protein
MVLAGTALGGSTGATWTIDVQLDVLGIDVLPTS